MRDAKGHFVKGDAETAKIGGHALQRQIAELRNENERLRATLEQIQDVLDGPFADDAVTSIGLIVDILAAEGL